MVARDGCRGMESETVSQLELIREARRRALALGSIGVLRVRRTTRHAGESSFPMLYVEGETLVFEIQMGVDRFSRIRGASGAAVDVGDVVVLEPVVRVEASER